MSNTHGTYYPKQRLSYKEKIKDNNEWAKEMINFLTRNFAYSDFSSDSNKVMDSYDKKLSNYQLYNNILNQKDFERECNPLGFEVGQYKDEIQPYNKTYNKIQVLLGEEYKRPMNFKAVLINSEGIKQKDIEKSKQLNDVFTKHIQEFTDLLQAQMGDPNNPELQKQMQAQMNTLVDQKMLEKYNSTSFLQSKEITASKLLEFFNRKESIQEKKNDAFKHGLIAGEEIVWVGVKNGEPTVEVINPLGFFYHKSSETKYIQDGLYAGYRTKMTTGDIIDRFGEYLSEDDLDKLESYHLGGMDKKNNHMEYNWENGSGGTRTFNSSFTSQNEGSYGKSTITEDHAVIHVEWVSQKKVGFITTSANEYGDGEKINVDENFKVPSYATKSTIRRKGKKVTIYSFDEMELEWGWLPEVWEGVSINEDMFCCIGPKAHQYRSMENPHKVKLGYHGLVYNNMNAESISLMDRMKPFQYLYFILVHKLKKLVARDKGQVFSLDLSMIPEEMGLEKTLYYLDEMDLDLFNPLQNAEAPGAAQRGKVKGAVSRSNMQHILHYISLMDAVDAQISDVAGITRQREGQIGSNEAVTNTQQNIIQSSTITEAAYFQPHFKLWEHVYNSVLDCASAVWKGKSVTKQYVLDDLSIQTIKITPDVFTHADYGVFVSNSGKEFELFNSMKALAQPLIQNDKANFSDIIALYKANSLQELEREIKAAEKSSQERQQAEMENAQTLQQQQIEAQKADREDRQAHEVELQNIKDTSAMEREIVKATSFGGDADANGVPDVLEMAKFQQGVALDNKKFKLEEQKLKQQKEKDKQELEIKRQANRNKKTSANK